jgi:hypothetical protein
VNQNRWLTKPWRLSFSAPVGLYRFPFPNREESTAHFRFGLLFFAGWLLSFCQGISRPRPGFEPASGSVLKRHIKDFRDLEQGTIHGIGIFRRKWQLPLRKPRKVLRIKINAAELSSEVALKRLPGRIFGGDAI